MMKFVFFAGLIGLSVCDVSLNRAPYSPSGYRPSPASLALPGEYGAPPVPASVQVSQENVQFAGQTVEVNSPRPSNAYLPPSPSQFGQLKAQKV